MDRLKRLGWLALGFAILEVAAAIMGAVMGAFALDIGWAAGARLAMMIAAALFALIAVYVALSLPPPPVQEGEG